MARKFKLTPFQPKEHDEQVAVFAWAKLHENRCARLKLLFATLNGVRLPIGLAVKMKRAGNKQGVPDIFLPVPKWESVPTRTNSPGRLLLNCGLWIELKRGKGGVVSEAQDWWHTHLRAMGYKVEVCAGAREAIAAIADYLQYKEG